MTIRSVFWLVLLCVAGSGLSSCGYKGDLYLPKKAQHDTAPASEPGLIHSGSRSPT
ncbi:MAG: lipoprotein [Magnetococcales bacterium]|nr:lipoprotein [Magnetococcales bacterium]